MTEWFARPVLHVTDVEASLRFNVNIRAVGSIRILCQQPCGGHYGRILVPVSPLSCTGVAGR